MDPDTSKGLLCQDASAWKAKPFRGNLAGSFFKRGSVTPRSAWHNAWVCHSFSSWGFGFMSKTFFFLYDPQWCCCKRMSGMLMGAPQELIYLRWPCWPPWGGCEGAQAMASGTLEVLVWRLLAAGLSLCYFVNSGRASWEGLIRRGWANRGCFGSSFLVSHGGPEEVPQGEACPAWAAGVLCPRASHCDSGKGKWGKYCTLRMVSWSFREDKDVLKLYGEVVWWWVF